MGTKNEHEYSARLAWDGNGGEGTATYEGYTRGYRVMIAGKPDFVGTADPMFRGVADLHNPEDLFLASISACHMLSYLALCARNDVRVVGYEDMAIGTLVLRPDGGGSFEEVTLRPLVTVSVEADEALAMRLHDSAHDVCFISSSCRFPIRHEAAVRVASVDGAPRSLPR